MIASESALTGPGAQGVLYLTRISCLVSLYAGGRRVSCILCLSHILCLCMPVAQGVLYLPPAAPGAPKGVLSLRSPGVLAEARPSGSADDFGAGYSGTSFSLTFSTVGVAGVNHGSAPTPQVRRVAAFAAPRANRVCRLW